MAHGPSMTRHGRPGGLPALATGGGDCCTGYLGAANTGPSYPPGVDLDGWVELEWVVGKTLWAEFAEAFHFRSGVTPEAWPAIIEPEPSVVWDLSAVFEGRHTGGFPAASLAVARLVLKTLQDCTQWWESVAFHDWVHPSALFRPHSVDEPEEVTNWDTGGLFPNGDYTIFVGRDHAFGILGHPWEQSLCVFGATAVEAFTAHNRGVLDTILRERQ